MSKSWFGSVALAGLILAGAVALSQPPPGRDGPPRGRPPRFELGRVLPPPLVAELELTKQQQAEIARLEQEVRARLSKILTAEQKKKVENFRPRGPRRPGGPPRGRPDRPPPGRDGDRPERPDAPGKEATKNTAAGIQWFATWESGLSAARRTGRPILLVSAAPHCAGVSGTW